MQQCVVASMFTPSQTRPHITATIQHAAISGHQLQKDIEMYFKERESNQKSSRAYDLSQKNAAQKRLADNASFNKKSK